MDYHVTGETRCRSPVRCKLVSMMLLMKTTTMMLILVLIVSPVCFSSPSTELFLNSDNDCGFLKPKHYQVNRTSLYKIRIDSARAIGNCGMKFESAKRDGRLCILQNQPIRTDHTMRLEIHDGSKNELILSSEVLTPLEWCTKNGSLTMKVAADSQSDRNHILNVDLVVYNMQGARRQVSMHSRACGDTFEIDRSQMTVTAFDVNSTTPLDVRCTLLFENRQRKENGSLCLRFEPDSQNYPRCRFNYTLEVREAPTRQQKEPSYVVTCGRPLPYPLCTNSSTLELKLYRSSSKDRGHLFRASVSDIEPSSRLSLSQGSGGGSRPTSATTPLATCLATVVATVMAALW